MVVLNRSECVQVVSLFDYVCIVVGAPVIKRGGLEYH